LAAVNANDRRSDEVGAAALPRLFKADLRAKPSLAIAQL
jgi:hypothetical protein